MPGLSAEASDFSNINACDRVSVVQMVTHPDRQDTAACVSLSFTYNVNQREGLAL